MPRENEAGVAVAPSVLLGRCEGCGRSRVRRGPGLPTVADAVAAVDGLHPGLAAVTAVSTLLLDGGRRTATTRSRTGRCWRSCLPSPGGDARMPLVSDVPEQAPNPAVPLTRRERRAHAQTAKPALPRRALLARPLVDRRDAWRSPPWWR